MSTSLIIGDEAEPQIAHFSDYLRQQGCDVRCLLLSDFPQRLAISWEPDCGSGKIHLTDSTVSFSDIKSVYWHRSEPISRNGSNNANAISKKELQSALSPLLHCNDIRWVNSLQAIQYHHNKPRQLNHAVRLGAQIPPTYIGNDVEQAEAFLKQHKDCIFKPVQGGLTTQKVTSSHRKSDHLQFALSQAPITLQANVGDTNIRTYVIGNHQFSAELPSEETDFRNDANVQAKVINLPQIQADLARRICRGFGMHWCAIDWRCTAAGQYYFLEANPCPYFLHFEQQTALPITQALASLLTH